jgi:hypothetical protein
MAMARAQSRSGLRQVCATATALALAWPAAAQTQNGGLHAYIPLSDCPFLPGLMLLTYKKIQEWHRHELSEICLDPSGPHLYGSEPITGLTYVDTLGTALRYQVVSPNKRDHERLSLVLQPGNEDIVDGLVGELQLDDEQPAHETSPFWEVSPSFPLAEHYTSQRHPDRDFIETHAYVVTSPLPDADFPSGTWTLHFTLYKRSRPNDTYRIYDNQIGTHVIAEVTFDGRTPVSADFAKTSVMMTTPLSDPALGIAVEDGRVGASLRVTLFNPRAPEVRSTDEWHAAVYDLPLVTGHTMRGSDAVRLRGLGVGTMTLFDSSGRQEGFDAIAILAGAPGAVMDMMPQ